MAWRIRGRGCIRPVSSCGFVTLFPCFPRPFDPHSHQLSSFLSFGAHSDFALYNMA